MPQHAPPRQLPAVVSSSPCPLRQDLPRPPAVTRPPPPAPRRQPPATVSSPLCPAAPDPPRAPAARPPALGTCARRGRTDTLQQAPCALPSRIYSPRLQHPTAVQPQLDDPCMPRP
ncbi:hypothetical protein FKM82_025584 [Ascaphus truei]